MKKLSQVMKKWLLVSITAVFFITDCFIFITQTSLSKKNAREVLEINIKDIKKDISDSTNYDLIWNAITIRQSIEKQEQVSDEFLSFLVETNSYGISEINIINKEGIITYSSDKTYVGYNMYDNEITASFLQKVQDESEYVSEIRNNVIDKNQQSKYAGIIMDNGNFLQIGCDVFGYQNEIEYFINIVAKNRHVGENGFIIIADPHKRIISGPESLLGTTLKKAGINISILKEMKPFSLEIEDKKCLAMYSENEGYTIVSVMFTDEISLSRNVSVAATLFTEILAFAVLFSMITFLNHKLIIENLQKVDRALMRITGGNLEEVVNVRSNKEFSSLSDNINLTVEVLRDLRNQSEHENKMKSMFLANMSHEIRTPMNAIVGLSELALDLDMDEQGKNYLRQIRTSGLSLITIINDILDFSKIESGKMQIVPDDYELMKFMNDVCNVILVRIQKKPVELFLQIDPELPSILKGDDIRIRQIMLNIAGNATKFTEKGHITVRVEDLRKTARKSGLRISIIDTGIGIKPEDLNILFNAFQQVDMKVTRKKEGTGLGLSISKNLLALMNGSIRVESEYGRGTKFVMEIPQEIVNSEPLTTKYQVLFDSSVRTEKNPELAVINVEKILNKKKFAGLFTEEKIEMNFIAPDADILVVDDNEVNLQVAEGLLNKFKVKVSKASSGEECLKRININKEKYDIVFIDHMMPGKDGIETIKEIRENEQNNEHPVYVALSANAVNGAKQMFISNGFDDFVAKPVQGKDFADCLLKWIPQKLLMQNSEPEEKKYDLPFEELEKKLPDYDKTRLDLRSACENNGGFENWLKSAKTFFNTINNNLEKIEEYSKNEDIKNYTILVHALKSSAKIIGAEKLSKQAEYLEQCGKKIQKEDTPEEVKEKTKIEVKEKTPITLRLYKKYEEVLSPFITLDEIPDDEKKEISDMELFNILNQLPVFADKFDLDSIEQTMKLLKKRKINEKFNELIKDLENAVENIDFDIIKEIVQKITL